MPVGGPQRLGRHAKITSSLVDIGPTLHEPGGRTLAPKASDLVGAQRINFSDINSKPFQSWTTPMLTVDVWRPVTNQVSLRVAIDAGGEMTQSAVPIKRPSACERCGNICFLVVHDE